MSNSIYQLTATKNDGSECDLANFNNHVCLVVNTASKCGFTGQYEDLETLYQELKQNNFAVLAFPCNQFGSQEPGNNQEIQTFCSTRFNVSFPLFAKVEVNGNNTHPVFECVKQQAPGVLGSTSIKWNFTKFLVDKTGKAIKRYSPATSPESIKNDIFRLLKSSKA
jgi:glutathione peroxidase